MSYRNDDLFSSLFYFVIITLVLFAGTVIFNSIACDAKWETSGFKTTYGPIKGCLIRLPDGRWIPEENYREIP